MDILKIAGMALLGAFTAVLLKNGKAEYSTVIGIVMTLLVCGYVVINLLEVFSVVEDMWSRISSDTGFLHILMRVIGITYISDITANICRECGYQALAGQVTTAGKVGVMLCGFPVFKKLLEFVLELGV